jgi:hypothetical protein
MGRKKGGGAPGLELALMGWVFGSSLATNGIVSLVTSSLFRGMALELAFRRKSGVEIRLFWRCIRACIILLVTRRP